MVTKKITRDAANASDLADKFEAQVPAWSAAWGKKAAASNVQLKCKPEDFAADLVAMLRTGATDALGLDQTHGSQRSARVAPLDARAQADAELRTMIGGLHSGASGQYGAAQVASTFTRMPDSPKALSTHTAELLRMLNKVVDTHPWTPLARPMSTVDLPQAMTHLKEGLAALDAAIDSVGKVHATETTTIADRDHGEQGLHRLLIGGHSVADGLLTAVGMEAEASRLALVHHGHPAAASTPATPAKDKPA